MVKTYDMGPPESWRLIPRTIRERLYFGPEEDQKFWYKFLKVLRKTNNNRFPHEAHAFRAKVQAMLAQANVTWDSLDVNGALTGLSKTKLRALRCHLQPTSRQRRDQRRKLMRVAPAAKEPDTHAAQHAAPPDRTPALEEWHAKQAAEAAVLKTEKMDRKAFAAMRKANPKMKIRAG